MAKRNTLTTTILKAMSLFGGVQVVNIVCSVLRNKIISVILGPAGIGLINIYNSAAELLSSVTSLGIRNSAARDLAAEHDATARATLVRVVRRWSWIVGILGAAVTIALSPLLRHFSFGDYNHTWLFALLSTGILVSALTQGESAVLQGTCRLSALARGGITGSILALASVFPLLYFFKESGVVPMILCYYFFAGIAMWWVGKRKELPNSVPLSQAETIKRGKSLLMLGIMLTLSSSITYLFNYLFLSLLKHLGTDTIVGYYSAGNMLVRRYADLIFAAMAVEYFPRLAAAAHSKLRLSIFVSKQMHLTLIILIPVLALFITCRYIAIQLLYTSDFYAIEGYIALGAIGTVFRAVSWCMSFVIIAKADGKMFLITEAVSDLIGFALYYAGYALWGITGIGAAYIAWYAIYTVIIGLVYLRRYRLTISTPAIFIALIALAVASAAYLAARFDIVWLQIAICIAATAASAALLYRTYHSRQSNRTTTIIDK